MRPSHFNRPLPKLNPQPHRISRMMNKRRDVKEKRVARLGQLQEALDYIQSERNFEEGLAKLVKPTHHFKHVYGDSFSWSAFSLSFYYLTLSHGEPRGAHSRSKGRDRQCL